MATKEKDDVSAPIAVLLMFLAFALAAGGLGNLDGGGGDGNGSQATSEDPCEDQPMEHVVADWPTRTGKVKLRCGDSHEGWEHLRSRDRLRGNRDNILNCVGRTLARGVVEEDHSAVNVGPQWVYRWKWGTRSGERAVVRVSQRTGAIRTAYPGSGPTAKLWARCAGR